MMILVPAVGAPSEELLQDTLKSCIVSLMSVGIALLFLWQIHRRPIPLVWHAILVLPLALVTYAAGSMWWSHAYLGGVEMARWWIFGLILWLGVNTWNHASEETLLWGIHWGVTIASVWAAWQFWGELSLFPQGPSPASTFVNRNFFAEFSICALPYSIYLALQTKRFATSIFLAVNIGFNLCALMMTGTRSSLIALAMLLLFLPMIIVRFKLHLVAAGRGWRKSLLTLAITIGVMGSLGTIPTGNSKVIAELGAISANERAFDRGASMATSKEYVSGSFSVRASMWVATLRMAQAHPLTGVGAGAWEVEIPLYQTNMRLTETDYYAHNEIVQLVAEYGLVGWIFLAVLLIYLAYASWLTWLGNDDINSKAALRAFALCSLLMLFVVGNAGFPWRTAGTGALFALSLSILAASDAKLYSAKIWLTRVRTPRPIATRIALLLAATCLAIAACISAIALRSERDLVRSLRISMMIGNSDDPLNRRWDTLKYQALQLAKEGISLNPHYRKLTPAIGDQFAQWGDLKTAIWIWESVLASRPHVLALLCNLSRAYMELGQLSVAKDYLERAQRLQQEVPEVRALEIELLLRSGQYKLAVNRFEILLRANLIDFRLALLTYKAAKQVQYTPLMVQALEWRIAHIPSEAGAAWLTLGKTLAQENGHELQALRAFRSALEAMPDRSNRQAILDQIPDFYRTQIEATENRP